jgi:hypothetical protein
MSERLIGSRTSGFMKQRWWQTCLSSEAKILLNISPIPPISM